MNIILTGVTGTLGSQVLYELLKQPSCKRFFLLIRNKENLKSKERLMRILNHPKAPAFIQNNLPAILSKIEVFDSCTFALPKSYLNPTENNYFIHSAGCVNLSTAKAQRALLFEENLEHTKRLFKTFTPYLKKFTYISTAFSIGERGGILDNNYHNKKPSYRNHYEASKYATERFLLSHEKTSGVKIQILRPSILGGNIYKTSQYFISNYMVYYLIGRFFYKNPLVQQNSMRLFANPKSALNVVPVDYVAQVIAKVYTKDIAQLNIVQAKSIDVLPGLKRIFEAVGFNKYCILNVTNQSYVLQAKNKLEELYYNTIGLHLTKYLMATPFEFDTTLLQSILPLPEYNLEEYITDTIDYAKRNNFKSAW